MIQLFKNKSLKNNTKTGQGAGVSAGVRGAGELGADNKNAKKQRGRSMVEMLGVLAIIGVLSIGGIQGYTLAMRKYRANEILNVANKYAAILYQMCLQARENNPKSYETLEDYYAIFNGSWVPGKLNLCPKNIAFLNAGLGSLPNGTLAITGTYQDDARSDSYYFTYQGKDTIFISIKFDSQELCQNALAVAGNAQYDSWGGDEEVYNSSAETTGNCKGYHQDSSDLDEITWAVIPFTFN